MLFLTCSLWYSYFTHIIQSAGNLSGSACVTSVLSDRFSFCFVFTFRQYNQTMES